MFERTKVDNSQNRTAVAARIELDDGRFVTGRFLIARSKSLIDILNGPAQFIDFEPYDGDDIEVISKSSIRRLKTFSAPTDRKPSITVAEGSNYDPYDVLGLEKGASRSAIRAAFRHQSMSYHPDRYSSAGLPCEVMDYLEAMARRVNAAYDILSNDEKNKAPTTPCSEPVYTSTPAP